MEDKNWYTLTHLSGLLGIFGPAIVWVLKYDSMPLLQPYIKRSLNFQILMFIIGVSISYIPNVGKFLPFVVGLFSVFHVVKASIKAGDGINYMYPFSFEFIK